MTITVPTYKKLYSLSGNVCAFPGCTAPIFDTTLGVLVGEVCHIRARSPEGPRYDQFQTAEERDGYDNLILMCSPHNKIIDDPSTRDAFTVEMIEGYKQKHEKRFHNAVVKEDVLAQFLNFLMRQEELPRHRGVSGLSEAAIELLLEAAKDRNARILQIDSMGNHSFMTTNGRQFIESGNVRSVAKWKAALEELENANLIRGESFERQVFTVTNAGFAAADNLGELQ